MSRTGAGTKAAGQSTVAADVGVIAGIPLGIAEAGYPLCLFQDVERGK